MANKHNLEFDWSTMREILLSEKEFLKELRFVDPIVIPGLLSSATQNQLKVLFTVLHYWTVGKIPIAEHNLLRVGKKKLERTMSSFRATDYENPTDDRLEIIQKLAPHFSSILQPLFKPIWT